MTLKTYKFRNATITALGPSTEYPHIKATDYSYIEFLTDGKASQIERVLVPQRIDSVIKPGLVGDFYLIEEMFKSGRTLLIASNGEGILRVDKDIRSSYSVGFWKNVFFGTLGFTSQIPNGLLPVWWAFVTVSFGMLAVPFLCWNVYSLFAKYEPRHQQAMEFFKEVEQFGFVFAK